MLGAYGTRDLQLVGNGTLEYKRVLDSTVRVFGVFAIVAFLFGIRLARGYFLTALPVGLVAMLLASWSWLQWFRSQKRRGATVSRVLIVGQRANSQHVALTIQRATGAGLVPVGALTRGGTIDNELLPGIPVLGGFGDLLAAGTEAQADTVILTGADDISPRDMRHPGRTWPIARSNSLSHQR